MKRPKRPSDPRDEPYYIDGTCNECRTALVLACELDDEEWNEDEIWYDEWKCPDCQGGLYMDWPDERWEELLQRVDDMEDRE